MKVRSNIENIGKCMLLTLKTNNMWGIKIYNNKQQRYNFFFPTKNLA